jgi:protein ImuB
MTVHRFLVLHLPTLATDRLRQAEPALRGQPLAAWVTAGNRRQLTAVDAPGTTLHPGQALADAQAMHPELVLRLAEPEADAALLERLALWGLGFTPLAAADPPDGLVFDIAGCTGLFGGAAQVVRSGGRLRPDRERSAYQLRSNVIGLCGCITQFRR